MASLALRDDGRGARRRYAGLLTLLVLVTAASGIARDAIEAGIGLQGTYVVQSAETARTIHSVDREIATTALSRAWPGGPPPHFQASWAGYLVVTRPGLYTFATDSDDGSQVTIDGIVVVDNGGEHGSQLKTGTVRLPAGSHDLKIGYGQAGGGYALTVLWGRAGAALSPLPPWVLWWRPTSQRRALAARVVDRLPPVALLITVLAALIVAWREEGAAAVAAARALPVRVIAVRAVLLCASLAFAMAAGEFAARAAFRNVRSAGDMRTYFANAAAPPRVNNIGYRGPDVMIAHDSYRIVVVGDSITWGQGLTEDERFGDLIQHALGNGYEVVNLGLQGRNIPDHVRTLSKAVDLRPNFILVQLFTNDFEVDDMERPRPYPLMPWRSVDESLLRFSALYSVVSGQWQQWQPRLGLTESYEQYMARHLGEHLSPSGQHAFALLGEFFRRAKSTGVPFGAVMFPHPALLAGRSYPFDFVHERVLGVCREEQARCLDLREPFVRTFHRMSEIVVSPLDGHPSPAANHVAAEELIRVFGGEWRSTQARKAVLAQRVLRSLSPQ